MKPPRYDDNFVGTAICISQDGTVRTLSISGKLGKLLESATVKILDQKGNFQNESHS